MISGYELIESLKAMSDEELTEVSRIIVVGRDWKAQDEHPLMRGPRSAQWFPSDAPKQGDTRNSSVVL